MMEQVDLEVGERIQYKYVILEEQVCHALSQPRRLHLAGVSLFF